MTLVRPSAVITLNGNQLTSAQGAVVRVRVRLGLGPAHDSVEVFCWPTSKLNSAAVGDQLTIALGAAGSESDVLTGEVSGVRITPDGIALEGLSASIALSRTYMSQSFISVSVSDVVNQLASTASVDVDSATGDTSLSWYAVDDRRSAWAHINDLARLVGADVSVTEGGKLKFVAPSTSTGGIGGALGGAASAVESAASDLLGGGGSGGLRYGANVVDWRATTRAVPDSMSVAAIGSASEDGSAKWHWLRSSLDAVGSGPVDAAASVRTRDGATAISDALVARAKRAAKRSVVAVVGDASLRPGATTQISNIPSDSGGDLRIVGVEHLLDSGAGWITRLTVEAAA